MNPRTLVRLCLPRSAARVSGGSVAPLLLARALLRRPGRRTLGRPSRQAVAVRRPHALELAHVEHVEHIEYIAYREHVDFPGELAGESGQWNVASQFEGERDHDKQAI